MRNKYLAKVLVANKFASEDDVRTYWPQVSAERDFGQVLLAAGKIDEKTYRRVLAYVMQLEAKSAAAVQPSQAAAPQSSGATFGRSENKPVASQVPQAAPQAAEQRVAKPEAKPALQIEGNNSLYGSTVSSSGVQVETVAGLESTKLAGGFKVSTAQGTEEDKSGKLPDRFVLGTGDGEPVAVPETITSASSIVEIIAYARAFQVTDVYLYDNRPIVLRRFGMLYPASEDVIATNRLSEWLLEMSKGFADLYTPSVGKNFRRTFALAGVGRARLVVTWSGVTPSISIRLIATQAPDFSSLFLPEFCSEFGNLERGLVLIAGPAASGRTTTLTAFGEAIAASRYTFLETVEKPVERFLQNPNGALVQREVGMHTASGVDGIRAAMNDGANVLLFDSVSNVEELSALLSAANAGMLVFATTTGNNTVSMLNRFLDEVAKENRNSFASSLADQLKGVIVQHLVPLANGEGLVLAAESLKVSSSIANFLRKGDTSQIPAALPAMRGQAISIDDSLQNLVDAGYIAGVEAWKRAFDSRRFAKFRPARGN